MDPSNVNHKHVRRNRRREQTHLSRRLSRANHYQSTGRDDGVHLPARVIFPRDSSKKCADDDSSPLCEKATGNNNGMVIGLSVAIPVVLALLVFGYLYRRSIKKRKLEDANDKHKSLDFGIDNGPAKGGKNDRPPLQMSKSEAYQVTRTEKGVSMDLGANNPYLLPAVISASRDSFHSLSRTASDKNDPYRPSTFARSDSPSLRATKTDAASVRTATLGEKDAMGVQLLRNAQDVSSSTPPPPFSAPSTPISTSATPPPPFPKEESSLAAPKQAYLAYSPSTDTKRTSAAPPSSSSNRDLYAGEHAKEIRENSEYLAAFLNGRADSPPSPSKNAAAGITLAEPRRASVVNPDYLPDTSPPSTALPTIPPLATSGRPSSSRPTTRAETEQQANVPSIDISQPATEMYTRQEAPSGTVVKDEAAPVQTVYQNDNVSNFTVTPPTPGLEIPPQTAEAETTAESGTANARKLNVANYNTRRLSMGVRPLPPEDPSDNPEQRANRIRSFYKEYFDESRPDPFGYYEQVPYYEVYGYGQYNPYEQGMHPPAAPYAQGMGRRAMTPPPRQASRFHGASRAVYSGSSGYSTPPRVASAMSARPFGSIASAPGMPAPGFRGRTKKRLPPPAPLSTLPTPHKLKEDAMVFDPLNFAPPTTFRDRQAGRPDSPLGVQRPYSPNVRAHLPLASSYDDLNVMPSPHHLRKSGTFTALDFAPPPRFRNADSPTASDAGSIRSNRSGISAVQQHALRAGAHRVSRIPKNLGGTKNELGNELRPTWEMRGPNPMISV